MERLAQTFPDGFAGFCFEGPGNLDATSLRVPAPDSAARERVAREVPFAALELITS